MNARLRLGAPIETSSVKAQLPLRSPAIRAAELTGDGELVVTVTQSENAYSALRNVALWFKKAQGKVSNKDARTALKSTLGAIEAADYLGAVAGHYGALRQTIEGSILAIRNAHGTHCRCRG